MNSKKRDFDLPRLYDHNINRIFFATILLTVLALVPLVIISFYNHPSLDDYFNAIQIRDTWLSTGSVWQVVLRAAKASGEIYYTWQGTFSGLFFANLQPFVFDDSLYALVGIVLIGTFVAGNLIFFKVVFMDLLRVGCRKYLIISLVSILLCIECVISPVQSFYWMNGSVIYTFIYSMMLLLLSSILSAMKEKRKPAKIALIVIAAMLGFICSGGNFIVGLVSLLLLFAVAIASYLIKSKNWYIPLIAGVPALIGFAISLAAPGNSVRLATMPDVGISPLLAILKSFFYAGLLILSRAECIILFVLIAPMLARQLRDLEFDFRMPIVVSVASFCILSAMLTPTLYAQNYCPGRVANIALFAMITLECLNAVYWIGYLVKRKQSAAFCGPVVRLACIASAIMVLAVGSAKLYLNPDVFASVSASISLCSGQARNYLRENEQRDALYKDDAVKRVEVAPFSNPPYVLLWEDIRTDPDDWRNVLIANYYRKESVVLRDH